MTLNKTTGNSKLKAIDQLNEGLARRPFNCIRYHFTLEHV